MVLIEKITFRDEPKQFDGVYENEFADNAIKSMFIEQGKDQTLWVMQTEFIFRTFLMNIVGPRMRKRFVTRTQEGMNRFKQMTESRYS